MARETNPATRESKSRRPSAKPPCAIIVMGVSGVGKTTIAKRLAKELDWQFRDGDSFHPPANVEKMSRGEPLTDADREPWLRTIAEWVATRKESGIPAIVACSALKRSYRALLIGKRRDIALVHLHGDKAMIAERMARRKGHFMPTTLLDSQFATLELPTREERAVEIDVAMPPARCVERIIQCLGLNPSKSVDVARGVEG